MPLPECTWRPCAPPPKKPSNRILLSAVLRLGVLTLNRGQQVLTRYACWCLREDRVRERGPKLRGYGAYVVRSTKSSDKNEMSPRYEFLTLAQMGKRRSYGYRQRILSERRAVTIELRRNQRCLHVVDEKIINHSEGSFVPI